MNIPESRGRKATHDFSWLDEMATEDSKTIPAADRGNVKYWARKKNIKIAVRQFVPGKIVVYRVSEEQP